MYPEDSLVYLRYKQREKIMIRKLYDVPRNTRIKVVVENKVPPGAPQIAKGEELNFRSIDGMYSYCTRDNGEVVHLAAWTEVEIIENQTS